MSDTKDRDEDGGGDSIAFKRLLVGALLALYRQFVSMLGMPLSKYSITVGILYEVADRFEKEYVRKRLSHGIKIPATSKNKGFITYWLSKLRPIHVHHDMYIGSNAEMAINVNALFAIFIGTLITEPVIETLDEEFMNTLVYMLNYRSTTPDNIASMFYLLEKQ